MQAGTDYTALSLAEVRNGLESVARDAHETFGRLDERQLNWKPEPSQWSVAQCVEHLLTTNRLMFDAADEALDPARSPTLYQKLPSLPRVFGRLLIRSQAPDSKRKYTAVKKARPSSSNIAADVVERFVEQHRDAVARVQRLDEQQAARTVMTSPLAGMVIYSVLDGWRLVVAHDWRHVEQARRVMQSAGFPR